MGTQDIYNLKWNHFYGNLDFNLKDLLLGRKFTDVILVSDDKKGFKAHKFILSACSPVLRDLLIKHFHPNPTIYLRGIHSYELEAILYFLYLGKTKCYPSRMKKFFEVGKELQINRLKDNLEKSEGPDEHHLNEHDLKTKLNEEELEQNGSLVFVTEADLKTYNTFTCYECKAEFKYKKYLVQHIRSKHEGGGRPGYVEYSATCGPS